MASCFSRGPLHSPRPRWKKHCLIPTCISHQHPAIAIWRQNMVPRWKAGVLFPNDFVWGISQPSDFCMLYFSVGLMCTVSVNLLTTVQRLTFLKGYPTWGHPSNIPLFIHDFHNFGRVFVWHKFYGNFFLKEGVNAFNMKSLTAHIHKHLQLHPLSQLCLTFCIMIHQSTLGALSKTT